MAVDAADLPRELGSPPLRWTLRQEALVGGGVHGDQDGAATVPLTVCDKLSAPYWFIHYALAFPAPGLGPPEQLQQALQAVLALFPTFCGRAVVCADGDLALSSLGAGAGFLAGTSDCSLDDLLARPQWGPAEGGGPDDGGGGMLAVPDLLAMLFGHLPPTMDGNVLDAPSMPLVHTALVTLADGTSVLGLRVSHALADWATLRLFLRHLASAFGGRPLPAQLPQAGDLFTQHLAAQQLPAGFQPDRLRIKAEHETAEYMEVAHLIRPNDRTTYHVTAAEAAALKAEACWQLQEAGGGGGGWVSTHDAMLARVWLAIMGLPGRRGVPHEFCAAIDLRQRLDPPLPPDTVGNLVWTGKTEGADVSGMGLGEMAAWLRGSLDGGAAQAARDMAWALAQEGTAVVRDFTWTSPVDALACIRSGVWTCITSTQWGIDFGADASFGGLAPVLAVPGFVVDSPFPLILTQPAPQGGWMVHVFLYEELAEGLRRALPALVAAGAPGALATA